jgi:formylglycine-generating enzyme required for sulfatase activity
MHGNVWEWVEDCYHADYNGAPKDGSAWIEEGECSGRVVRGGSWVNYPRYLRAASRVRSTTGNRYDFLGFRVGRTLDR